MELVRAVSVARASPTSASERATAEMILDDAVLSGQLPDDVTLKKKTRERDERPQVLQD